MLFSGGVSFFGLLAVFPAIAVAVALYGLVVPIEKAQAQAAALAFVLPPGAQGLVLDQLSRLAATPIQVLSVQGAVAFFIAWFGSIRGVKALTAGLNRLYDDRDVRNVFHFNVFAFLTTIVAIAGAFGASTVVLTVPVILETLPAEISETVEFAKSGWTWAGLAMWAAITLLYYVAMGQGRIRWRACLMGAGVATGFWLLASKGFAVYAANIADFGATYGSIGAVVVFLMWIYLTAYSIFLGGALTVEIEAESIAAAVEMSGKDAESKKSEA